MRRLCWAASRSSPERAAHSWPAAGPCPDSLPSTICQYASLSSRETALAAVPARAASACIARYADRTDSIPSAVNLLFRPLNALWRRVYSQGRLVMQEEILQQFRAESYTRRENRGNFFG